MQKFLVMINYFSFGTMVILLLFYKCYINDCSSHFRNTGYFNINIEAKFFRKFETFELNFKILYNFFVKIILK